MRKYKTRTGSYPPLADKSFKSKPCLQENYFTGSIPKLPLHPMKQLKHTSHAENRSCLLPAPPRDAALRPSGLATITSGTRPRRSLPGCCSRTRSRQLNRTLRKEGGCRNAPQGFGVNSKAGKKFGWRKASDSSSPVQQDVVLATTDPCRGAAHTWGQLPTAVTPQQKAQRP